MSTQFLEDKNQEDDLLTASRLRVWWLTRFARYSISLMREEASPSFFGRRGYRSIWLLKQDKDGDADLELDQERCKARGNILR